MSERMPNSDAIENMLLAKMHADLTRPKWWRRWWAKVVGASLAVGVVSVAVAGVMVLNREPVTATEVVHCFSEADINPDGGYTGVAGSVLSTDGVVPVYDAIAVCSDLWAAGWLTSEGPAVEPDATNAEVPSEFTMCVMKDGSAAVVPGSITCSVLKLNPYEGRSN